MAVTVEEKRRIEANKQDRVERLHEAGARRHPKVWFQANRAAINVAWSHGIDPSKLDNKYFIAEMVLRILDATQL